MIEASAINKPCPKCRRTNAPEARICVCGFWFIDTSELGSNDEVSDINRTRVKKKAGKLLTIVGYAVAGTALVAWWAGFLELPGAADDATTTQSATVDVAPASSGTVAVPASFQGRVSAVLSGDSINVTGDDSLEYRIRLSGVDAPESGQEFAGDAIDALARLVMGKNVNVAVIHGEDRNSIVAKVIADGRHINLDILKMGAAWHNKFSKYQTEADRQLYAKAEQAARAARAGLWSSGSVIAPWDFRAGMAEGTDPGTYAEDMGPAPPAEIEFAPETSFAEHPARPRTVRAAVPEKARDPLADLPKLPPNGAIETYEAPPAATVPPAKPKPVEVQTQQAQANSNTTGARKYILGPRGGCYYISASGSKSYVDKSRCGQ